MCLMSDKIENILGYYYQFIILKISEKWEAYHKDRTSQQTSDSEGATPLVPF